MHHALHVQEILLSIFGHWYPPEATHNLPEWRRYTTDLAALARTCKTFKEPALDLLWSELVDLSPLARCVPKACQSSGTVRISFCRSGPIARMLIPPSPQRYSFSRPINEVEWNTLRSYTRRVWFIHAFSTDYGLLDDDSIRAVFNPPSSKPLFPNLRSLYWRDVTRFPVKHVAVPLLTSLTLHVHFYPGGGCLSRHFLDSAADLSPNIKQFRIYMSRPHPLDETISRHICRWTDLEVVDCPNVALNAEAVTRLSSMSTLTRLAFTLSAELTDHISDLRSTLVFSNLDHMGISSGSLDTVGELLPRIQLPVVHSLVIKVGSTPSEDTVQGFAMIFQNTCPSDTLTNLELLDTGDQIRSHVNPNHLAHHTLSLRVVQPWTAFSNLLRIHINLKWTVILTDDDLIDLVSATPCIESLVINDVWGWRTDGGITLVGLHQLLWSCPSLYDICLAVNTSTHTYVSGVLDQGFPEREGLRINVVDSDIEMEEVVPLVSVWKQLNLYPVELVAWSGADVKHLPGARVCRSLWEDVFNRLMQDDAAMQEDVIMEDPPAPDAIAE
ncbi:hypothetical protein V8E55_004264 [Tylopilus felleus]